ncbi:phytase [Arenimonas sp. MALMAid1274]|uniref:phytase n=1 Tax=Arenimonas sp. MALMAid1274 TaxID=3411630 RepID=UPI003BA2D481
MKTTTALLLSVLATGVAGATPPAALPSVTARLQTEATAGEANASVLVRAKGQAGDSRIVGTAGLGGLELYGLDGRRRSTVPAGEAVAVDVAYDLDIAGTATTVLAAVDTTTNLLRLYTLRGDTLAEAGARPLPLGFRGEGVCLFRHRLDNSLQAFIVGDGGEVDQQLIYANAAGKLDARQVRRIAVPSTLKQCVVASDGQAYASEEAVGIWRFTADPEADVAATVVDSPRLGGIREEVGGLAVYDGTAGERYLFASDASAGRINVYDRAKDEAYLGSFTVRPQQGADPLEEPGPLHASAMPLGKDFPRGMLLVGDEDNSRYLALSIADITAALSLPATTATATDASAAMPVVRPRHETAPVRSYGDTADDPAIWPHPTDPAQSLVVATDKKAGLYLYDLQGREVHFVADGKMNNVDLRDGFPLGGREITLVAASDRTRKAIALYALDAERSELVDIADGVQPTGLEDPYGLCLYRSPKSGKTYVFINSGDGPLNQWELVDAGNGKVRARLVREMRFESQTEGCVADDAAGTLFIGEEDLALWRLDAEPDGGDARTAVDRVDANPAIKDDLEGVGLYDLGGGRGYLVVSSQGNDSYAVYRREGRQEYLGSFVVVADGVAGIDGISETDGLDVSSANLGPGFETGAMVAQDGRNVLPVENQNYKIVPWSAIARALGLEERRDD